MEVRWGKASQQNFMRFIFGEMSQFRSLPRCGVPNHAIVAAQTGDQYCLTWWWLRLQPQFTTWRHSFLVFPVTLAVQWWKKLVQVTLLPFNEKLKQQAFKWIWHQADKLSNIKEDALDNREKYLDVMCFPVLFPTGQFGEHHPCQVKLRHCEYIKSWLLNKDPRFRKDPQYVFFLLWQKEMREILSGVYNLLKSTRRQPMSVSALLHSVEARDEHLHFSEVPLNLGGLIFRTAESEEQSWWPPCTDHAP